MLLPRLMVITDRRLMQPDFGSAMAAAFGGGARFFQLREKGLSESGVLRLALKTEKICKDSDARYIINFNLKAVREANAFGVHLPESHSVQTARQAMGREYSVSQSVHSPEAAQKAEAEGADFLVFGSVFATDSHIGSTPAGLNALGIVTRSVSIPVFAVGGITAQNATSCLDAGAHGVAVIRAVWSAPDIVDAMRELIEVLDC